MSDVAIDETKRKLDINSFQQLRIGLANADDIRNWSRGEVKKPETINYRTLRPERDGLFCEKIFGPTRDWECYCGKYKRVRFKGIICEKCGVEVTRSKVRRERMGHIELAAPVVHIWYLRGTRSWLAYLLGGLESRDEIKAKQLEKVIYFAAWLVSEVDEDKRHVELSDLENEYNEDRDLMIKQREKEIKQRQKDAEVELKELEKEGAKDSDIRARQKLIDKDIQMINDRHTKDLDRVERAFETFQKMHPRMIIDDEELWREIKDRYEDYFKGGTGAEAIKALIDSIDFIKEEAALRDAIMNGLNGKALSTQRKQKAIKRLKIVASFNRRDSDDRLVNNPKAMILDVIPVIPPELRPMVQLDGGRFATSDLNDLYRRVINRNNRLSRLLELGAPEIIVNNEKRMLQEAADALFDNGRRGRPVSGPGNRPLKSLSDGLKGKQGRFRQNLLGKRVDYSGRSVIVAGPTLRLQQCGLPKLMALELFKPFVMKRLADQQLAQNIKSAKRMVERRRPQVWDVLEEVIKEHPVLLNRAPTLHRLGIQAFEPVLVEGKAIHLHPLVCTAFNADFDGDQMAVHLPLSVEAQAEARVLMLSANNILSPASGRPIVTPQQDLVIGGFYLTREDAGLAGEGRVFKAMWEVTRALDEGSLNLHAKIKMIETIDGTSSRFETTAGRLLFEEALPKDFAQRFGHITAPVKKKEFGIIVERLSDNYPKAEIASSLDAIKNVCYRYASQSGLTVSVDDVKTPSTKRTILEDYEKQAEKVETQFRRGIITDGERRSQEVRIWTQATTDVQQAMEKEFKELRFNPVDMMISSGARGNMTQMRQIAGMRGLVANPRGDMIPRPIKSNFREGLETLEYFIATPGARKGLVDTALRTADSGYLTRRLHDVAQELIVREDDCGTTLGVWVENVGADTANTRAYLETKLFGRALLNDVELSDGSVIPRNTIVGDEELVKLRDDSKVTRVRVRSVLTCDAEVGVCAKCYGRSLATGKDIELGEAVGVIAAQSIGEPGTQLTMRTFHTGGVAGKDIAGGLPRVVELFEARNPKGSARLVPVTGVVRILEDEGKGIPIKFIDDQGQESEIVLPTGSRPQLKDGQNVEAGERITDGPLDPKELMQIKGIRETQQYLVEEVQKVYRDQGVSIHDKHIELIIRQMTRRVSVQEPGDTHFLPGHRADSKEFRDVNRAIVEQGKKPAEGRPELMGITKASLATESWLSAASFQETTRVLTEAAIDGRSDHLVGLKENIIIGKLIPAGTGMDRYNLFDVSAPDYVPMPYYSSDDESDPAAYLAGLQGNYVADEQLGEQTGEQIGDYSSEPSVDLASTTDVAVSAESEVSLDASPDTDIAQ
ncbi:MAG: DNA-directed RNA polymerase subunit beta' [Actinobacteria bacterium]|nr:DNA-directed RNA polymerase subunit beta' [Actinomycetota bacterium]